MENSKMSYGELKQVTIQEPIEHHAEELMILGYTLLKNVLNQEALHLVRGKTYHIYEQQIIEFGSEKLLDQIAEKNLARALLHYDDYFIKVATQKIVLDVVKKVMGQKVILSLQNGIINKPALTHHQTKWHRDLPYQNFIISEPLALSALFLIDDFSSKTGGTIIVPYSHKLKEMPSEQFIQQHQVQVSGNAGDVLLFDSMLMHRAGCNTATHDRVAINHMYTAPIIKQQIDLVDLLDEKYNTVELTDILGYSTAVAKSVIEWRQNKHKKLGR